jgi:hypothetical protein
MTVVHDQCARRAHHIRRVGAVVAALLSVTALTGCGVRNDYSATERTTAGSVNVDAGPLALRHLRVVLGDGSRVGSGGPVLRGSFVNGGEQDDELLAVTSPAANTVRLAGTGAGSSQTVPLAAGGIARLEHPQGPGWTFEGARGDLPAGTSVRVTFHFAHQGRVTATVPVAAG